MSNESQKLKRKLRNLRYRQKQKTKTISQFKPSKLEDLNASSKKYEELRGFEEIFKGSDSPSSMGEDRKGTVQICSICGTPLEKDGSCPMCARCE